MESLLTQYGTLNAPQNPFPTQFISIRKSERLHNGTLLKYCQTNNLLLRESTDGQIYYLIEDLTPFQIGALELIDGSKEIDSDKSYPLAELYKLFKSDNKKGRKIFDALDAMGRIITIQDLGITKYKLIINNEEL